MCPHCQTRTMHVDRTGSMWHCAASECGFTTPIQHDPAPLAFERFGAQHKAAVARLHGAAQ